MKVFNILVFCLLVCGACTQQKNHLQVHLKGQLADMGSREVAMEYSGISGDFGKSKDHMIYTDAEGHFDTTFTISEPAYFYISRNIMYLTPGDDLTVFLTPDNRQAVFTGKGSDANSFLKDRLYPKGGSFLESGQNVRDDFEQTKECVDSLAAKKLACLDELQGVSTRFKANERARIKANLLNSYLSYRSYNRENVGNGNDERKQWHERFISSISPEINRLMKEVAKNEYLDIVDVRDVVIYNLDNPAFFKDIEVTPQMREIAEAQNVLEKLDTSTEPGIIREMENKIAAFKNRDIVNELQVKVQGVKSLMTGQPAPDIVMTDTAGNEVLLSSFKGKIIYLDCWATWCGPCIQESPAFNALSAEYQGKDIVFIQLSTDNSRKAWLDYLSHKQVRLPQYNSVDNTGLRIKWQVKYIPRFMLIDKDFNIVRAFAPRPSDPEIVTCLNDLLKGL